MVEMLSAHVSLREFERSDVALRHGLQNKMSVEDKKRAILLCEKAFEPVRAHFGPIRVNCGFRAEHPPVNKLAGGVVGSHHATGEAMDIEVADFHKPREKQVSNYKLASWIVSSGIKFTQVILEYPDEDDPKGGWVHLSYRASDLRCEVLTRDALGWREGLHASSRS